MVSSVVGEFGDSGERTSAGETCYVSSLQVWRFCSGAGSLFCAGGKPVVVCSVGRSGDIGNGIPQVIVVVSGVWVTAIKSTGSSGETAGLWVFKS